MPYLGGLAQAGSWHAYSSYSAYKQIKILNTINDRVTRFLVVFNQSIIFKHLMIEHTETLLYLYNIQVYKMWIYIANSFTTKCR